MWLYFFVCFLINTYFASSFEIADSSPGITELQRTFLTTKGELKADISRFESAQQLQQILKCVEIIIIHDAASTNVNSESFEVSANEIENLTNSDVLHFCVRALRDKLPDDLKRPFKWIRLAKILETLVLNEPKVKYSTKKFVQFTENELRDSISVFTFEALNASVRNAGFERNSEMDNLTTAIYLFDPLQWEYMIEEFINANYKQVPFENILKIITSHKLIQQRAKGLCKLFGKLENAENLNSNDTNKIALALHELHAENEFQNLNKTQLDEVNETIDKLPTCIKNLIFHSSVSCWNADKTEYIAAKTPSSTIGSIRRLAFSADPSMAGQKNAILAIIEILETRVLNEPNVVYLTNQFKKFTTDELKYSISVFTLEALNASVKNAGFERDSEIGNLTYAIYLYDPLQWECIMEEFINTNYDRVSFKNILKIIQGHKLIQQRAKGLIKLFGKIENTGHLNTNVSVAIKIASALQKLRTEDEFKTLCKTDLDAVNKIIDKLPTCARNLVFLPSVCLWNKGQEKYVTASDNIFASLKRYIVAVDPSKGSHWNVTITGDDDIFLFSSHFYPNEALYASPNFKLDYSNLRYSFAWTSEAREVDRDRKWNIVLKNDYCYIKNEHFNEYLFSSEHKINDEKETLVLTKEADDFDLIRDSKLLWQIRECN